MRARHFCAERLVVIVKLLAVDGEDVVADFGKRSEIPLFHVNGGEGSRVGVVGIQHLGQSKTVSKAAVQRILTEIIVERIVVVQVAPSQNGPVVPSGPVVGPLPHVARNVKQALGVEGDGVPHILKLVFGKVAFRHESTRTAKTCDTRPLVNRGQGHPFEAGERHGFKPRHPRHRVVLLAPGRLAVTPIGRAGHVGFIHEHGTQFIAIQHPALVFDGAIPAFVGVVPSLLHELEKFGVGYLAFGDVKGSVFHVVEVVKAWEAQS